MLALLLTASAVHRLRKQQATWEYPGMNRRMSHGRHQWCGSEKAPIAPADNTLKRTSCATNCAAYGVIPQAPLEAQRKMRAWVKSLGELKHGRGQQPLSLLLLTIFSAQISFASGDSVQVSMHVDRQTNTACPFQSILFFHSP